MRFKKLISIVTLFTLLCFSTAFATTTSLFPYPKFHAVTSTGAPLSGGKLYTYEPGTTTPKTTYIDSAGTIANTNPVILNTNGDATIYFVGVYDIVLISSTGTMQWSLSSVSGINSTTTNSVASEWILQSLTSLTYIGATQFSAVGDVRTSFPTYIRVKAVVTAGIIYGTVSTSSFGGGVTTVTVSWDSGSLDSGLSVVSTGILTPTHMSIPSHITVDTVTATTGTITTVNATTVAATTVTGNGTVPVGSGIIWFNETCPTNFIPANGASLDRTTYASLFAVYGTVYGAADGSHFNAPDTRGYFIRGWANGQTTDPDRAARSAPSATGATGSAGDHVGTTQADGFKAHAHQIPLNDPGVAATSAGYRVGNVGYYIDSATVGGNETRPLNLNVLFCIKY